MTERKAIEKRKAVDISRRAFLIGGSAMAAGLLLSKIPGTLGSFLVPFESANAWAAESPTFSIMVVGRKQMGIAVGDMGTFDPQKKTIKAVSGAKVTLHSFYNDQEVSSTSDETGKVVVNIDGLCSDCPAEAEEPVDSEGKQLMGTGRLRRRLAFRLCRGLCRLPLRFLKRWTKPVCTGRIKHRVCGTRRLRGGHDSAADQIYHRRCGSGLHHRGAVVNFMIGLDAYTISSGIFPRYLNGDNIVSVPLKEAEVIRIGYIVWLAFRIAMSKPTEERTEKSASFLKGFVLQLVNVKIYMFGITALTGYVVTYWSSFPVLLLFEMAIATIGTIATSTWIGAGLLLQKLYLKRYRVMNATFALILLECAWGMVAS